MTIGEKIRVYREMRGLTQVKLAERTGINVGTIRKYELGIRNPKQEQLKKIADGLSKNIFSFYDLDIATAGDIMALLIAISEKTGVTFIGKNDEDNRYDSSQVAMKFNNPYMQELMASWAFMKSEMDSSYEDLEKISDENTKAKEFEFLSDIYNKHINILTDAGHIFSDSRYGDWEEILNIPTDGGLDYHLPFDKNKHFPKNPSTNTSSLEDYIK